MQRRSGSLMIALLAFALALRVLVPTGWMPAWSGQGQFAFVPCPAAAPAPQAHGHNHHSGAPKEQPAKQHQHQADKPCPFAPLLSSAAPPDDSATDVAPVQLAATELQLPPPSTRLTNRAALRIPPSTGPPSLA